MTTSLTTLAMGLAIALPVLTTAPAAMAQASSEQASGQTSGQSSPMPSSSSQSTRASTTSRLGNWLQFFRPPTTGVPRSTGNGSSREGLRCSMDDPFMQPLLPESNYGLTLDVRPEIFVEIPQTSAQKVLLVFRSDADNDIQRTFLPIPTTAETDPIVGFRLPDGLPGLTAGETYQWSLTFICGDYFALTDPTVMGWVHRQTQTAELDAELAARSPQAQIEWLGNNGYWYDLAARLAKSPTLNP